MKKAKGGPTVLHGLTSGKINLNTGTTKYFNVFENNTEDDTLYLVEIEGRNEAPLFTVVAGSGAPSGYTRFDGNLFGMESQGRMVKAGIGIGAFPNTKEGLTAIKDYINQASESEKVIKKCSFWVFK